MGESESQAQQPKGEPRFSQDQYDMLLRYSKSFDRIYRMDKIIVRELTLTIYLK